MIDSISGFSNYFASSPLANFVWPSLYLTGRLWAIPIILISLVVEFVFVLRITELSAKASTAATFAMNLGSMLLGILLIPVSGLIWEYAVGTYIW